MDLGSVSFLSEFHKVIKPTNKLAKIVIIFFKLVKISKTFGAKRIPVQLYRHLVWKFLSRELKQRDINLEWQDDNQILIIQEIFSSCVA